MITNLSFILLIHSLDGVTQLLTVASVRGPKNPMDRVEVKPTSENGGDMALESTVTSVDDSVLEDGVTDQSTKEANRLEARSSI